MLEFEPLSFDIKKQYDEYFALSPVKYCEYSFFSLWGWREAAEIDLAFSNNLCWVKSQNLIYGPVGNWRDESVDWRKIFEQDFNNHAELCDVPEDAVEVLRQIHGNNYNNNLNIAI